MRELILIISALGLFQQAICQCVDFSIGNEWHYYATSYLDDVYNEHWYYSIVVSETLMVTDQHFENYAVVESPDAVSYLRAAHWLSTSTTWMQLANRCCITSK